MSSKRRGFKYWFSVWWPVTAGIALIALESTEFMGSDHTRGPLRWLFQAIFGPIGDARWDDIHHLIRKSGHFLGYGGLGLAWLRALWMSLPPYRLFLASGLALAGTALVASWDEWHQTSLPNRTGSPWDVLLDCCGALSMLLATFIYLRLRRPLLLHDRD